MSRIQELAGAYSTLALSTLQTRQTNVEAAITALLTTGQSYTFSGRTVTRGDLPALQEEAAALGLAIDMKGTTRVRRTHASHA